MAALFSLAALLVLPALWLREAGRERRRRAAWLADCLGLFESYRVVQAGSDFPRLAGRYRGVDVRLELVSDDLAWRKLPSLWLKATVLVAGPHRGTLGLLARARGGEVFSPTAEMAHDLPKPAGFPADAVLRSDAPAGAPVAAVAAHVAAFDDARMKELVVTPRGVRLVYQAAQADRAHYLVLRQSRFPGNGVEAGLVQALLDRALAVAAAADAAALPRQPAAA